MRVDLEKESTTNKAALSSMQESIEAGKKSNKLNLYLDPNASRKAQRKAPTNSWNSMSASQPYWIGLRKYNYALFLSTLKGEVGFSH